MDCNFVIHNFVFGKLFKALIHDYKKIAIFLPKYTDSLIVQLIR